MELGLQRRSRCRQSSEATSRQKPQTQHLWNTDSGLGATLSPFRRLLLTQWFSKWGAGTSP